MQNTHPTDNIMQRWFMRVFTHTLQFERIWKRRKNYSKLFQIGRTKVWLAAFNFKFEFKLRMCMQNLNGK